MNMKLAAKIMGKVGLVGFIGFVATFTIYMFNLENKLIYYVLRPFLNKHYDSPRICPATPPRLSLIHI